MEQGSSAKWYGIGALVIIAFALWYVYGRPTLSTDAPASAVEQAQTPELSAGDTVADISAGLQETPDTSAALDADAASAAAAIQDI